MRSVWHMLGVSLVAAAVTAPAYAAGVVQTLDGRLEGDVAFADGRIEVGGKAVPWDQVVYAMPQGAVRTLPPPGAVRLAGGEAWRGDVLALSDKRLSLRSALLGTQQVDIALVWEIEFSAAPPDAKAAAGGGPTAASPGTLCREKGEPVPGTLLWINEEHVAIDSPLGVLKLPRQGAVRYTFARDVNAAPKRGDDRVGLVDGSVVRGAVKPVAGGVRIEHPILGGLTLGAALVHYVERFDPRAGMLCDGASGSVKQFGILTKAVSGGPVVLPRGCDSAGASPRCLTAMRLEPKTVVTCGPRPEADKKARLTGRVRAVEGARGDARFRIRSGGKTVFEQDFGPGSAAAPVALELPGSADLVLEVDFGPRVGFPCGVVFEDPLLVRLE